MTKAMIHTYQEIKREIDRWGILPLSSYIAEHPSLESLTPKENWHTDQPSDPWLWRVQLADEKAVAYGKFFKKKPTFLSLELYPYIRSLQGDMRPITERFEAGIISRHAYHIHQIVEERGIVDARELRGLAGLREKEQKTLFENALVELQSSFDLVITGSISRFNEQGEKNGWNSMGFSLATQWFADQPELLVWYKPEEARAYLTTFFQQRCTVKAFAQIAKLLRLS
ncbi:MAG: hypothetical protein ACM32O_18440 [Clostridia bacterium]